MNRTWIWASMLALAILLGIGAAAFAAPMMSSQTAAISRTAALPAPFPPNGTSVYGNYGPGRMGNYYGPGRMGGYGYNQPAPSSSDPVTVEQAKSAAEVYIQSAGLTGLEVAEVMVFSNNAYVVVRESETGHNAFELLVDPSAPQIAYPEYGPNMMWNLKYGNMAHGRMAGGYGGMGMMGNWNYPNAVLPTEMTVTAEQAVELAQAYLDQSAPGTTAASTPMAFYGYYTLDYEKDGKVAGMVSVNGFSGQVFPHTWHETFISEKEFEK